MIHIDFSYSDALPESLAGELSLYTPKIEEAYSVLKQKTGKGNDFLGWLDLPETIETTTLEQIKDKARAFQRHSEIVVVIGIGGSYLGARAVIELLSPYFPAEGKKYPEIVYAGNHLSEEYLSELLHLLEKRDYSIVVISKSGTTTEPAIAFRVLKKHCEKKYGLKEANNRIIAITDKEKGALKEMSKKNGYTTFVIPDDVGGRYSVLTPVGLLPVAIAGFNIDKLLQGARNMRDHIMNNPCFENNISIQYAFTRYFLYSCLQKKIELMVAYEPKLFSFIEWFKQLFGESEGKEGKGIFPAGAIFTTDLHSLGQYIQEGERSIFETVLSVQGKENGLTIPHDELNLDNLNYLENRNIQDINRIAEEGTRAAHVSGGVPNTRVILPGISEEIIGELIYFFEFSCALGGYLIEVNPFDQPGVEVYKKNMFRLLGKPE